MGGITSSSEMPPSVQHYTIYVNPPIYVYTHLSMYALYSPPPLPLHLGSCYPMGDITSSSEMPPSVRHYTIYVNPSIYVYTHLSMYVLYPPPLYSGSCYPIGGITSSSEMPPQFDSYVDMCTYPYMNRHIYLCFYYNPTPPPHYI